MCDYVKLKANPVTVVGIDAGLGQGVSVIAGIAERDLDSLVMLKVKNNGIHKLIFSSF